MSKLKKAFAFAKLSHNIGANLDDYVDSMMGLFKLIQTRNAYGNNDIGLTKEINTVEINHNQELFSRLDLSGEGGEYYIFPGRLYE